MTLVKNIPKAELTYLQTQGIKGILDQENISAQDLVFDQERIEKELQDSLKASLIKIQFMAVKFSVEFWNNTKGNELKDYPILSDNYYVPEKLYFSMNFFDFPLFRTDTISYEDTQSLQAKYKNNE